MIDVMLLGPPRIEQDGALVAFDTRKAVALLAHLSLTERPRPREALADLLWPNGDPDRSRGALRRTLSSLRGAVGADLVEATRDHVRLVRGPGLSVDVDRFRALRERGDLDHAVELFRGDFLEGFAVRDAPDFEDWARTEADNLRRELVAAVADLAAQREAAGDLTGAVRCVHRWLALDPLHEPAHRALMGLYAAMGDRKAALVQYRDCARTLSRELGVPPLKETSELYEAINRGAYPPPAMTTGAPSPPRATPPGTAPAAVEDRSPFVGRADDLRALRAVYDGIGTDGRVVVVQGEAGIGKTRLVEELLHELRPDGVRIVSGRAYEDEGGLAYAPLADALRARLADGDDWLATVDDSALREAARLVPELVAGRSPAHEAAPTGPGAETRFLSGLWDTLAAAAGGNRPGVIVIDDAQWSDEATQGVMSYGLRRLAGRRLLVVLTWRSPHDQPLLRAASTAARAGEGIVLRLDRLGRTAVEELVRATRPDSHDQEIPRRLLATTEGVPLLLVEYLRTLDDVEHDAGDGGGGEAGSGWTLPSGARELLSGRLHPVGEIGRQVLAAAAVVGRSFDVDTVRTVSGRTDDETVSALEELVRRGLVRERSLDYDFGHELLRTLVYDETSLARRRLLHARAGQVPATPAAVRARHLQLAGRDDEAAHVFRQASDDARQVYANAEALSHLRAALQLGHPDRSGLHAAIGDVQTVLGDYAGALISLEAAATTGAPAEQSAIQHRLGRLRHRRGEYALAQAQLQAALESTADTDLATRAALLADLSLAAHFAGDDARARALARDARSLAEQAGDPRTRCLAHNLLGMLATADGATDTALGTLRQGLELAEQIDDQALQVAALNNLALAHRARSELTDATELTAAALDLCTRTGDRHHEAALHNNLADLLHASGHPDEAMAHLKSAVEIFAEIGAEGPRPEIWKLVQW